MQFTNLKKQAPLMDWSYN